MLKTRQIDYLIMRKKRKLSVTENETVKLKQKYFDPHYYNLCKLDKVGGESQEDDVVLNDEYGHFGINLNNKKKEIMNIHSQNICLICRQMECVNNECCPTTMEVITKINKHRQNINNIINNISSYKYNDNEKTYNNNMNTNVDDGNKKLCCQCSNSTIKCNKSFSKKKNFHHNRKLHSAYTSHFNELTTLIRSPPLLLPLKISEPLLQKQKPQQPFTLSTLPLQEQPLSLMNKRQITMPTFSMISHSIFDYNELNRFYRFSSRVCNSIRNCISKSTQRTFHKLSIIYLMLMSLIASLSLAKYRFKINTQNLPIVFILVNFIVSIVLCPCVQASFQSHSLSLPTNEIIRSSSSGNIGGLSTDLSTEQVRLQNPGHVCTSKDIRNDPIELRALENCTVIEGFLLLVLMEKANHTEFENWSFPKLTEITEFLFIYRVSGLRTLAQLFPNLSVIRGNEHFNGFGLAVYENNHLEEIGLKSLTTIKGGGVRIEKNPSLCFVNTVDWKMMTSVPPNLIHLTLNKPPMECPQCPDKSEWCWNSKTPQKMCPKQCSDNCNDKFECCHSSCVGGCAIDNPRLCTSCRYLEYNGSCVRKCPPNHFEYIGRSCITAEECIQNKATKYNFGKRETLVPFNGTCSVRCPPSYNKVNGTCVPCEEGKCIVKCPGGQIETLSESRRLDGCTHIIELPLIISVKQTGPHVMHELETAMSSIETIDCYLKIVATHGVVSLSFLKNLKHIKGEILEDKKFALYVLENNSLERLFSPGQNLLIERGRLFFHFNPKLCFKEINELRSSLGENKDKELDYNDVARDSNGSKGSCHKETLNVIVTMTSPTVALVNISNPMVFDDSRKFIGYQFYYMVDPYRNATMYSDNSCDSGWKSNGEAVKSLPYVFTNLQPYTQYAFYVKTYTISSENRSGQSDIHYFRTKPTTPSKVTNVNAKKQNGSEVLIQWEPPNVVNGNLTAYVITVNISDSNNLSKDKNYCKEPSKGAVDLIPPKPLQPSKETSLSPADCNCEVVPGKEKIDESDRQDEIDFENSIHNYIYIKHRKKNDTSGSLATNRRRRRDTSQILLSSIGEKNYSRPEDRPNNAILKEEPDLRNIGRLLFIENDQNGRYIERISKIVNSSITSIVIGGLKHFTDYMVYVSACRATEQDEIVNSDPSKWTNCSLDARTFVRTEKLDNVDIVRNVQLELENTNNTRSNVRVKWDPPDNPNGMIVAYTIKYKSDSTDAEAEKRCITEWDYQNLTTGYPLSGLQSGNYSVEVRANSLAGEGKFSEPQYIYVPSPGISNLIIAVIVIVLLALISTFGLTFFYIKKKYMNPEPDLTLFTSVNPEYFIMESYVQDEWEIPRESIIQLGALGQGSFGMVYEGIVKKLKNHTEDTPCAIKTVNDHATNRERSNFLQEAIVMKEFNTSHVVRLLGVVSQGQPTLVVMELMKNGDLKAYLRQHRPNPEDDFGNLNESPPQPPTLNQILQMAIEIADGMAYLSAKKFVHRDLAARNCMVSEHLTVKIGDFGMTRDVYETDYYRKGTKGLLPVRWMSPESLKDGLFNSTSDVFSYGVVLWEMATLASQPYQGLSNDQVLRYVIDGGVMERPENCPDVLYNLMQRCWQHRPSARPTFIEIIQYLLENSTPKFHEPLYFHSPECQEAIEQIHVAEADDTTPLRMGEYDYRVEMDDSLESENRENLSVQEHHSPYSLGSAILMSSTPGISKQSMPTNQSNQSLFSQQQLKQLQKPMTSAAALAESGDVTTTTIISQPNIGPSLSDIMNETMPKKLTGSNTATTTKPYKTKKIQSSSLKRAVAETVQNVNSLVPSRLGRMDFIRNRFFNPTGRTNSNNVVNNNSNPINNSNNNNNINNNNGNGSTGGAPTTSLLLQLNANLPITTMTNFESETGMTMGTEIASSSGGRGFFSALTPSHTSKNPNYQILNESLNISTDEQNLPDSKNQDVSDEQHELRVLPLQSLEVGSGSSSHKLLNQTNKQYNDNKDNNFKESLRTNTVKVQRKPTPQKSPQQTRAPQSSLSLKTQSPSSRVQPHSSSSSLSSASSTSLALVLSKSTALQSHPTSKDNKKNSDSSHIKPHNIISTSKPAADSETKTINKSFTKEQWLKNENQQQQKQQQPPNGFIGR